MLTEVHAYWKMEIISMIEGLFCSCLLLESDCLDLDVDRLEKVSGKVRLQAIYGEALEESICSLKVDNYQ